MNKRVQVIASVGLFLVLILGVVYVSHGSKHRPSLKDRSSQNLLSDLDDTPFQYVSAGKAFVANFPAPPQHATGFQEVAQRGEKVGYDIYVSRARLGTIYMINVIKYPPTFDTTLPEKVLRSAVEEICAANPQNTITKAQMGNYNGLPSLDFSVENPLAEIQGRAILKGTTLFVISVVDENKDAVEKHRDRFLSSFSFGD